MRVCHPPGHATICSLSPQCSLFLSLFKWPGNRRKDTGVAAPIALLVVKAVVVSGLCSGDDSPCSVWGLFQTTWSSKARTPLCYAILSLPLVAVAASVPLLRVKPNGRGRPCRYVANETDVKRDSEQIRSCLLSSRETTAGVTLIALEVTVVVVFSYGFFSTPISVLTHKREQTRPHSHSSGAV